MNFERTAGWSSKLRPVALSDSRLRTAVTWLLLVIVSVLSAAFVSGRAAGLLGQTPALLLLAVVVGCMFLIVFVFLGPAVVVIWPIAATGGYLLDFPRSAPVITFDRLWVGGMLAYIAVNPRPFGRSRTVRLLLFAFLWLVVSYGIRAYATSATLRGPISTWVNAIVLPVILFLACERYCLSGRDRVRRIAQSLMLAGAVLAAIGIAERIFGFELATLTGGSVRFDAAIDQTRISGPYQAPEPYALSLIACLAATLYWLQSRKPGAKIWWAVLIALGEAAAVGLTLFRAAWIAAIIVAIASFGLRPGRFGRLFAVIALVAALALAATTQLEQNRTFTQRTTNVNNIYARFATYKQGLEIWRSSPVVGIGVNKYFAVASMRRPATFAGLPSVPYPHNSYIGLLAEQGIVGLLPFLLVSLAVWRLVGSLRAASFTHYDTVLLTGAVAGAVVGYLIMSLTLTMLPYEPSNMFFAALLGAAAGRLDGLVHAAPAES